MCYLHPGRHLRPQFHDGCNRAAEARRPKLFPLKRKVKLRQGCVSEYPLRNDHHHNPGKAPRVYTELISFREEMVDGLSLAIIHSSPNTLVCERVRRHRPDR